MDIDATAATEADKLVAHPEQVVRTRQVKIWLCDLCLQGVGDECHTPECALWLHNSPGMPIHPEMYEVLEERT